MPQGTSLVPLGAITIPLLAACGSPPPSAAPASHPVPAASVAPAPATSALTLPREAAQAALCRVLAERDRDCDRRITVRDEGTYPFTVTLGERTLTLGSTSHASQLVTELAAALKAPQNRESVTLDTRRIQVDPVTYLESRIQSAYFAALTRRIDADRSELLRAAADEKLDGRAQGGPALCPELERRCGGASPESREAGAERSRYVYYPAGDAQARSLFEPLNDPGRLSIEALPLPVTDEWMQKTTRAEKHGLLTLALDSSGHGRPFVVPGGRFNEMYGWDSFFITWGLLEAPAKLELARAMVDNHAYEIEHYGKILNANRTYYLTRSQPPFFAAMLAAVWQVLPHERAERPWLERGVRAALGEYRTIWSSAPRSVGPCEGDVCLSRYYDEGRGEPPEVEPGGFAWVYQARALASGACPRPSEDDATRADFVACAERFEAAYREGKRKDRALDAFFTEDRAVRESGHDTTYRWFYAGGEHCTDFVTVDLNALLFRAETALATLIREELGGRLGETSSEELCRRAAARARLMQRYQWDERAGLFFDYDVKQRRRSSYISATTLYPLWASEPNACGLSLVTPEMARSLRDQALAELEAAGGLLATSPRSLSRVEAPSLLARGADGKLEARRLGRQWEAPNGWAPHQMLAWSGLRHAGFAADAERLAYRWLYTIARNAADYHGTVPEKLDVVQRSHAVFQEYGNVGTEFSYIAEEGFGWMNASFLVGLSELGPERRASLRKLEPPETLW